MNNLTSHFTLDELTRSDYALRHGIDNTPSIDVLKRLAVLAVGLERVRIVLSVPLFISSGYRCRELNKAIGGSDNSAHCQGLAADFVAPAFGSPLEVAIALKDQTRLINFQQLIYEGNWVHISFAADGVARQEVLTAKFINGRVSYTTGIA